MLHKLDAMGYELTAWQGSEQASAVKQVAQQEFENNFLHDYAVLPTLIIVGSAYESVGGNVVGTVYYPDEDGQCQLGTCASDAKIVDFNSDDIPDMPWTRVNRPGIVGGSIP